MIKRGLVLGGGGSRGAYQVGAWKALKELDVDIDIVTGTSIGALNGALIVQNDFQGCVDLWDNIKYESVLSSIKEEDFKTYSGTRQAFLNFIRGVVAEGGLDIAPLETTVREMLDEDLIRNSKIDFGLVTVEYPSMKEVVLVKSQIPQGKMADYLLASAACYPAFKSRDIDNTKYVDGGYKNNLPIDMAIEMGANEVIAVDLEAIGNYVAPSYRDVPVRYIKSYWNLGLFLSFDKERIKRNMQLGYFDVMRSYRMIEGIAYAFELGEKDKLFAKTTVFKKALEELFGFSILDEAKSPVDRLVRSRIIKALNTKPKARVNVREYAMRIVELAAENMDISPTKIYTINEISQEIIDAYDKGSYISFKNIEQSLKEPKTLAKIRTIIENYEKKEVISFIYKNLQRIFEQKEIDNNIKLLAAVATKEFLAAMYIFAV
ncbi:MAG: patatin-like phospholipase family protein, partial [Oscillospiraceae bacterium]